jgi:tetratricopeptide (TPR) repeat protein
MKCPFLTKKIDIVNEEGKKVGEDIEVMDCIKNECMVYDGATNMCSLLSSNMKTGVLIDDIKGGFTEMKEKMDDQTETMAAKISDKVQTLLSTVQERFDIMRKQNEVLILGFDRISELLTNKLGEMKDVFSKFAENIESLQNIVVEIKNVDEHLFDEIAEFSDTIYPKFDVLNSTLEKLTTTNQSGMETIGREIDKVEASSHKILEKIDVIDAIVSGINSINELVKTEIGGMKNDMVNGLDSIVAKFDKLGEILYGVLSGDFKNELAQYIDAVKAEVNDLKMNQVASFDAMQSTAVKFEDLFKSSSGSLATINSTMSGLNKNYLESLGKIAGLAEGMRKGVENVGVDLHGSVEKLINEMKKEIGTLEKQYRKTFDDVGKLSEKFEELNSGLRAMTKEVQKEFRDSLNRQAELSDHTKVILENIKGYFEKEDARYREEQRMLKKQEGIDHFDRATLYYYRGNYELALNEINKALEIEKTAEYLNLKGLLLVELGRFDESRKVYTEALKLEPHLAEIHNNLGLLYIRMKKFDDAVVSFQEAIKKNVNYPLAYVNLGKALIDLERFDDAIKAYSRALEIDPSNQEAREAIKLYKEGKIEE